MRRWLDVAGFCAILLVYIWIVGPLTPGRPVWYAAFSCAAAAVAILSVAARPAAWKEAGLRSDNLLPASAAYLGVSLPYAALVLLWQGGEAGVSARPDWPGVLVTLRLLIWALLQEFCLLSFLLLRLREITGRTAPAVALAAAIFAVFHLPNPFLTLFSLGGGLIVGALFVRMPSLPAATVAHFAASLLVARLLPGDVTGWMKVGPNYWAAN